MALNALQKAALKARARAMKDGTTSVPNAPSADSISRVTADETQSEEYTIKQTGVIEVAFQHIQCVSALIYVHAEAINGVLQLAVGNCYLGRTRKHLTEVRNVGDESVPVIISETPLSEKQSARTFVNGTAGDKLLLIYR